MLTALTLLALCVGVAVRAAPEADKITSLPSYSGSFPSAQYSGYLDIPAGTAEGEKHIHYWFTESDKGADSPVVFWLNGGPGCSSLGGFWEEQGDLHFRDFRKEASGIEVNPYRWSRAAHVVYVEHPAGVGFSWADSEEAYRSNDTVSASDMRNTIGVFFDKFPEYANNPVWISGESYAGIYVPTTAYQLYLNNNTAGSHKLDFRGVLVGNGCIGTDVGGCSDAEGSVISYDFYNGHALIAHSLYEDIQKECGDFTKVSVDCEKLLDTASDQIGPIDIYNVLAPCEPYQQDDDDVVAGEAVRGWHAPGSLASRKVGGPDSCFYNGDAKTTYLNRDDVQEAIHVKKPAQPWRSCGGELRYERTEADLTKEVWPTLIKNYNCLVYSGDVDACVPYVGTEAWTSRVGNAISTVKQDWHPWEVNGQVAGYATTYNTGLTFATVKGAGHMVPEYAPEAALAMFERFIAGDDL